ncbi:MAG TPA: DinB family protein [Candidatus Eisenbacteria bacterium]
MDPAVLTQLFQLNHHALHRNVDDLTNDDALIAPHAGGNCLNWIVGHLVANRNAVLERVGEPPIWTAEVAARYARGSAPIRGVGDGRPFDRLMADFDAAQERIVGGLGRMGDADLARADGDGTVAGRLAFLQFHEAYHIGQAGLLRRIAGKDGAIR